ncbi:MAG: DNA-3-methyladenine glycosylase 2 family protein [Nitrosomonadales bacterium]|jgi:DNA-3-methyladenine glycosylase II|nr:MAG: DNA-3-methyladenine glycosylase 2 family protein [Nitrosomonadales bacterium]
MTPEHWKQATQELAMHDEVMHKLISGFKGAALRSHGDAFTTLARSIVSQQISVKAAESVWHKVVAKVPEITPQLIHNIGKDVLRCCGLSKRKADYLQDLSLHFINKDLNETMWHEMDDEALILELTRVKGVGRWTAEMFLIFHMLRPDVLPMNDLGLKRALSMHYNDNQPVSEVRMRVISELWKPWRSVATWYLWRSLDSLPVEY